MPAFNGNKIGAFGARGLCESVGKRISGGEYTYRCLRPEVVARRSSPYDPALSSSSPRPARPLVFCDTPATLNTYFQLPKTLGISALQPTLRVFYDNGLSQKT